MTEVAPPVVVEGVELRRRHFTPEAQLAGLLELHSLLLRVTDTIGPAVELQPTLSAVLGALRSTMSFRGGSIALIEGPDVRLAVTDPPVSAELMAARLPIGSGLVGRVVATGRPIYSPDLDKDPRVEPRLRNLSTNATLRSYIAVPLVCLRQVIGVLQVDSEEADAFDDHDLSVLSGIAVQVAGAIESARRFEAHQAMEAQRSDFIARVSHELRTPLTVISGLATTLRAHYGELTAEQHLGLLDRLETATDRLRVLVEELLEVGARPATVPPTNTPEEVDLGAVLSDVVAASADPDRVLVDYPEWPPVRVDRRTLTRALALLVDNALKYATMCRLSWIPDRASVVVEDDGPGIPVEDRERVFERFQRGHHSAGSPGIGLGLPLARALIEAMGGSITLDDAPEGGARFTVHLPEPPM